MSMKVFCKWSKDPYKHFSIRWESAALRGLAVFVGISFVFVFLFLFSFGKRTHMLWGPASG